MGREREREAKNLFSPFLFEKNISTDKSLFTYLTIYLKWHQRQQAQRPFTRNADLISSPTYYLTAYMYLYVLNKIKSASYKTSIRPEKRIQKERNWWRERGATGEQHFSLFYFFACLLGVVRNPRSNSKRWLMHDNLYLDEIRFYRKPVTIMDNLSICYSSAAFCVYNNSYVCTLNVLYCTRLPTRKRESEGETS